MGKTSFPKPISQGRRFLRNSPQPPGAPAAGTRRARLRSRGARPAWHQPEVSGGPRHCRDRDAQPKPPCPARAPKQGRKSPGEH